MERFKHLIVDPRLAVQYPELWADSEAVHQASYPDAVYADFSLALLLITKQRENPIAENMHLSLKGIAYFDVPEWDLGSVLRQLEPDERIRNRTRAIDILADFTTRMEHDYDEGFFLCPNGMKLHTYTGVGNLDRVNSSLPEPERKYPNLILSLADTVNSGIKREIDHYSAEIREQREEAKKLRANDEETQAAVLEKNAELLEAVRDVKIGELDEIFILTDDPTTIVFANQLFFRHVNTGDIRQMLEECESEKLSGPAESVGSIE